MKNIYILLWGMSMMVFSCKPKEEDKIKPDETKPTVQLKEEYFTQINEPGDTIFISGSIYDQSGIAAIKLELKNSITGFSYLDLKLTDTNHISLDTFWVCNVESGTSVIMNLAAIDPAGNVVEKKYTFLIQEGGLTVQNPDAPYELVFPAEFGQPYIPEDNELTVNRVKLGKLLFFDPILSKEKSVSCASCHAPEHSFSDINRFSQGSQGFFGERNSMSLINMAWSTSFFWDGSALSLEAQARVPLTNAIEMNMTIEEAVKRLNEHPDYPQLFYDAYQRLPDEYSLLRAIASYERTLISSNNKYDQFYLQGKFEVLNDSEIRGLYLFNGSGDKVHCSSCHTGNQFTNGAFENNGLYDFYLDKGRYKITGKDSDIGKFKVPTLRNVALTPPYMHDGSVQTLEEVVEFYSTGGSNHPNKSSHIHVHTPLTETEKEDLVNFLKALTDQKFIEDHAQ